MTMHVKIHFLCCILSLCIVTQNVSIYWLTKEKQPSLFFQKINFHTLATAAFQYTWKIISKTRSMKSFFPQGSPHRRRDIRFRKMCAPTKKKSHMRELSRKQNEEPDAWMHYPTVCKTLLRAHIFSSSIKEVAGNSKT